MKIGVVQFHPIFGGVARNIAKAVSLIGSLEADVWVFPELFATGYQIRDRDEAFALSEGLDGPTISTMAEQAVLRGCYFCGGFPERAGESVYNSAFLVGPEGLVSVYRKVHLFDREKELFAPGDRPFAVVDVGGVQMGMMICFDWIFPESARSLALQGAQVLLHPSNLVLPHCPDAMKTRALENGVFTVTANRIGKEDRLSNGALTYIGNSVVYGPDGSCYARRSADEEVAFVVNLPTHGARKKSVTARNDLFEDRRPALYAGLTSE